MRKTSMLLGAAATSNCEVSEHRSPPADAFQRGWTSPEVALSPHSLHCCYEGTNPLAHHKLKEAWRGSLHRLSEPQSAGGLAIGIQTHLADSGAGSYSVTRDTSSETGSPELQGLCKGCWEQDQVLNHLQLGHFQIPETARAPSSLCYWPLHGHNPVKDNHGHRACSAYTSVAEVFSFSP